MGQSEEAELNELMAAIPNLSLNMLFRSIIIYTFQYLNIFSSVHVQNLSNLKFQIFIFECLIM
ncbi:hypothetical protein Hanom_Chr14g01333131 [Helianthus anomalus]